ncbi:MAG: ABC transporter substrate-binding protein, partial [Clostridioides sp.]|jgi:peptide/nickel transport system substrate-binding protein|nr:ABC transporter substrate-binding protein [Clostridioides sp.]
LKSVLKGYGEIAYSPLQKGEFNNENINKFEYDQNKAKEEIKKLGWKLGKDGIYEKNNKKLSFEITANENDTVRVNIAKIASQQLRDIGVDANAKIVSEIDWKNQDATIIGWGSPFDPDDHTYKVFSTGQGSNFSGYSNKKVDELLKKARESTSKEEKLKLYDEFQEEMTKDMPYTFLVYIDAIYVGKDDIQGITENKILGHHGVGIFNNITNFSIK